MIYTNVDLTIMSEEICAEGCRRWEVEIRTEDEVRNVDEITSSSRRIDFGRICLISDRKS